MEIYKTRALVLRRERYSETSQVITFLTADRGRLSCVAKGSRRVKSPFGDGLSLFGLSEIVYYFRHHRSLQIVAEADLEWYPRTMRREPLRFIYASIFVDLLLDSVSGQAPDPALFDLALTGLKTIDRSEASGLPAILWSVELKLLSILGYRPVLDACADCGAPLKSGPLYFDPARGGIVCGGHDRSGRDTRPLSPGAARLLAGLLDLPLDKSPRHRAGRKMRAEIDDALSLFVVYHLGIEPGNRLGGVLEDLESRGRNGGRRKAG
jgi:DNA repair protein RecO (recombination protein O)